MIFISKEELLKEEQIFQQYNSAIKDDEYIRAVTVADIEAMPSVDAVEQKHGRLIPTYEGSPLSKCSNCKTTYYTDDSELNYCQKCGIKFE